jgi:hypothetical protein
MEFKILMYAVIQYLKLISIKEKLDTVGELFKIMRNEFGLLFNNSHNPLNYLQLHIINKTQNPFEALIHKASLV